MKKSFRVVSDSDQVLYEGDVVTLSEYNGHFILSYGWAKINDKPHRGWHFRSLDNPKFVIQAGSVNLALASVQARNDRPDESQRSFSQALLHS